MCSLGRIMSKPYLPDHMRAHIDELMHAIQVAETTLTETDSNIKWRSVALDLNAWRSKITAYAALYDFEVTVSVEQVKYSAQIILFPRGGGE